MTDIVERLQRHIDWDTSHDFQLAQDALTEIKRLRVALSNMLEDGDKTDRAAALALLQESN